MNIRFHLLLLTLLGVFACSKEESGRPRDVNVPPNVQPFVDQFVAEAAIRNQMIDLADYGLNITFQNDLADSLAAFCSEGTITINQKYWDSRNDASREAMIFHELGHCILQRTHLNTLLPNDEWLSMMRGDPLPKGKSSAINYSGLRREYYIDELFKIHTPEPDWIHIREDYGLPVGFRDTFFHVRNIPGFTRSMSLPDSTDYEIEVLIDLQNSTKLVGLAWGGEQVQDQIVVHFNANKTLVINAGLTDQGIIYQRDDFNLLESSINLITMRKRDDKYFLFVNRQFAYWMEVRMPEALRFQVLTEVGGTANFLEIGVYKLLSD